MFGKFYFIVAIISTQYLATEACGRGSITINNNGYRNILIAIADDVDEDPALIDRIKQVFTEASAFLYKITKGGAFFEQITILVPISWQGLYDPSGNETFDKSDIVVDLPGKTNQPFVIKTTPCGQYGHFMRLTTAYLMDQSVAELYGPYDKVIVHEWSHLRFGVFDEYPLDFTENHFYATRNGQVEGTRCTAQLQGSMVNPKTGGPCDYEGNFPEDDCRFQDDILDGDGYASIMYKTFLDHVTEFCDSEKDFPNVLHNREAPTLQNKMCGRSSIWDVIRMHPDFTHMIPPGQVNNTTPSFRVVKPRTLRTVLVLDKSGSMDGCNMELLGQGCSNYISNIIQDGEWLGIVTFNAAASKDRELTLVNDVTRQEMLNDIPTVADGGTSIGSGIAAALELLEQHDQSEKGGFLIVVSDGVQTDLPSVEDVTPQVFAAEVTVHSIAITDLADSAVDKLAIATGGLSFLFSDCATSNAINEAFLAIGELNTSPTNRSYVLSSEVNTIEGTAPLQGSVLIDSTLGRNTQFIFEHDSGDIDPIVVSPNGTTYVKTDSVVVHDATFRIYRFTIPQAEFVSGLWTYQVTTTVAGVRVAVTVKSQSAVVGQYPIVATASWGQRSLPSIGSEDNPKLPVYASVSEGYSPVLNADVEVYVVRPSGDAFTLRLYDNGAGVDAVADDGIYSSYYTYFDSDGRYSIQVLVNSNPATVVSPERIIGGGVVSSMASQRVEPLAVDPFTRSAAGGSLQLENFTAPAAHGKFYPPGDITDLRVISASYDNQTAVLTWTAIGAQLDQGQVSYYDLRIGTDFEAMEREFENQTMVTVDMIVSNNNLSEPQVAGMTETYVIRMPSKGEITYIFAVIAVDQEGRDVAGPLSNLASVSMNDFTTTPDTEGLSAGAIVGITLGILALLVIIIVIIGTLVAKNGYDVDDKRKKNSEVSLESAYENMKDQNRKSYTVSETEHTYQDISDTQRNSYTGNSEDIVFHNAGYDVTKPDN